MFNMKDTNDAASLHDKSEELKPSIEALEFLSCIGPDDIDQCLFVDSMVTASDTGKELGEFCVSVQKTCYNDEPSYLIRADSHGAIDNNPCGTSITAYISTSLETLEETQEEYMKLQEHTLEKKIHMVRQGSRLVVNRVITEKSEVKKEEFTFPLHSLQGFVSEACNLLIMRILARRKKVPENVTFLSFDSDIQIGVSTYRALEVKKQEIGNEIVEVFAIERTVSSTEKLPATWHCYFLPDGHLASRVQVGSSVTMNLVQLPPMTSEDKGEYKSVREKKPLIWEEDIELYSKFLDRKEELVADHSSYVRQHPELKALLADFLQMLLLRKPPDVFLFARNFFVPFDSHRPPDSPINMSQNITATQDNES